MTAQDSILQILIDSIEEYVFAWAGVRFFDTRDSETSVVVEAVNGGEDHLWLKDGLPILSVTTIEDQDADPDETFTDDVRFSDTRIWKVAEGKWSDGKRRWKITYTGGYSETSVPNAFKEMILNLLTISYHHYRASGEFAELRKMGDSLLFEKLRPYKINRMAN